MTDFLSKPVVHIGQDGAPHVQVDQDMQMMQYLADIAMEDLALLPDPSRRRVREGSLAAQYQADALSRHRAEYLGTVELEDALEDGPVTVCAWTGKLIKDEG